MKGSTVFLVLITLLPVLINSVSNDEGCVNVDGGGWTLVRHVSPTYGGYHPATDNCNGNDVYGTYDNDAQSNETWSITFSTLTFNQFLFSFGDCSEWLITTPEQVYGEYYVNEKRCILNSSIAVKNKSWNAPYEAKWYMRSQASEDPWISAKDHFISKYEYNLLYGENSYDWPGPGLHNGANVWIRYNSDDSRTCQTLEPSVEPSNMPSNEPTNQPSQIPTEIPSGTPSNIPSKSPTKSPTEDTNTGKSNNGGNSSGLDDGVVKIIILVMGSIIVLFCVCCCICMIGYLFNNIKNKKNKKEEKMAEQLMELTKKVDSFSQSTIAINSNGIQSNVDVQDRKDIQGPVAIDVEGNAITGGLLE